MHFDDLTQYEYFANKNPKILNVGWLDFGREFTTGEPPAGFVAALAMIPRSRQTRGFHNCPFCGGARSSAEKRVEWNGKTYAAPAMIDHYVAAHGYLPPQEFIDAVMSQVKG